MVILGYIWNLEPACSGDPVSKKKNRDEMKTLGGKRRAWDLEGLGRKRIRFGVL